MAASQYGTDYSRFMTPVPGEESWIPFPHPMNDGQRMANARARAARAGVDIGSGYLNPKTGELQDPDRGFGRAVLSKPQIMIPAVLGGGLLAGAAFGGGAGATGGGAAFDAAPAVNSAAGAANLGSIAGTGLGASGGTALGGVMPAAASGGGGVGSKLLSNLLSPEGLLTAGSIAASLASRGGGNDETEALNANALRQQAITEARMRRVDPLHEAVTQLAFSRLPVSSRNGINLPRVPLPE